MEATPNWVRRLTWLVGLPCWLGFAALIITGRAFQYDTLLLLLLGGFFASAVIRTFYAKRTSADGQLPVSPVTKVLIVITFAVVLSIMAAIQLGFITDHYP